jgi:hypothetical protein
MALTPGLANPLVPQGTLNLLRSSVSLISFPQLNVISSYLAEGMVSISFEGEASGYIGTASGAVPSPNPYQIATVAMHLLRTQPLSSAWKLQQETTTTIGDVVVTGDASTLTSYYLNNCTIRGVAELTFNGKDPTYQVTLQGTYYINSNLWNLQ